MALGVFDAVLPREGRRVLF